MKNQIPEWEVVQDEEVIHEIISLASEIFSLLFKKSSVLNIKECKICQWIHLHK